MTLLVDSRICSARLGAQAYLVSLSGEVDLHLAPELDDALFHAIKQGARRLVVDFTGAIFADSSVLGVVLRAAQRMQLLGAELVVVCEDRHILRSFELTGLDRAFPIEPTLMDALSRVPSDRASLNGGLRA
jgi:anti-sigma B factor antagonist